MKIPINNIPNINRVQNFSTSFSRISFSSWVRHKELSCLYFLPKIWDDRIKEKFGYYLHGDFI